MELTKEIEQDAQVLKEDIRKLLREFIYKHNLFSIAILPKNENVGIRIQKWEYQKYNEYKWII